MSEKLTNEFLASASPELAKKEPLIVAEFQSTDGEKLYFVHEPGFFSNDIKKYSEHALPDDYKTHHGHMVLQTLEDYIADANEIPVMAEEKMRTALEIYKNYIHTDVSHYENLSGQEFAGKTYELIVSALKSEVDTEIFSPEDRAKLNEITEQYRELGHIHNAMNKRIEEVRADMKSNGLGTHFPGALEQENAPGTEPSPGGPDWKNPDGSMA
ncbi:MAG: hypothetical protein R3E13_00700 [Alphaproteobacteria bacterium]